MIEMSVSRFIFLCLMIFAAGACRKEMEPVENPDGYGRIVLTIDSRNAILSMQSKATDLQEGNEFGNLLVIVTNHEGIVVSKKDMTYATNKTQDVISFDNLLPGNYHIYAYANYTATDWQQTGISTQEKTVAIGTSFSSYINRELASMTAAGTDTPANPASAMLLTGDMEVPVGLSTVPCELDLIRPVVRFKVTVNNHSPYPVKVKELRFSHFNPDKAYIIPHKTDDGLPDLPSGVTYRQLPPFDNTAAEADVAAEGESVVYQTLLYEGAFSGTHKIFATLMLDRSPLLDNLELSLGGEGQLGVLDYETISGMDESQSLKVLLVNPRTTTRSGRLYSGIGDTGLAWESCGYNTYNKFLTRAQAIYSESNPHVYEDFSYTGFGNNDSGLTGWSGNAADAPLKNNTFNYSGKKNVYYHNLTKTGGKYTLDGLTTNPPSGSSISQLKVVEVSSLPSNRFPKEIPAQNFVQFVNDNSSDASFGKYLKSDSRWNAGSEDVAKASRLTWEVESSSRHDHMFILFGQISPGGLLKRILKENNKEVPLTYLMRNEEVNVNINVYYADQEGTLNFSVDNSTWGTATTSSHTFK